MEQQLNIRQLLKEMMGKANIGVLDIVKYSKHVCKRDISFGKQVKLPQNFKTYVFLAAQMANYRCLPMIMKPLNYINMIIGSTVDQMDFKSNYLSMTTQKSTLQYLYQTSKYGYSVDNLVYFSVQQSNTTMYLPYFFVFKQQNGSLLIIIRGTVTKADMLTDIDAQIFQLNYKEQSHYFHNGFYQTAFNLISQLKKIGCSLENSEFVGHSMGAAIATICVLLLKIEGIEAKGMAFSPPPSCDLTTCKYLEQNLKTYIIEQDPVPELSVYAVRNMIDRIGSIKAKGTKQIKATRDLSSITNQDLFIAGKLFISNKGKWFEVDRHEFSQLSLNISSLLDHLSVKYVLDYCE
ncbi:Lipase_(Class 3) and transmembrane domain-containing protein [Hexamita inflata]|uniref:sn-1-specific diacylglycerol lipase n=1 Tax=Hexamita inflata TaxID=28002 RepID=A0AA86N3T2_9EUKA|nr:Lipase (Class 3) and transmembrane domain-containing protein [Hexamita inflata]CAI9912455.1 Lipase (Class 3) and transmembrane domain-containing protein [Hexamita inflata]